MSAQAQVASGQTTRRHLTKLIYAALFLLVTGHAFVVGLGEYYGHLIRAQRTGLVSFLAEHGQFIDSAFFFVQLALILPFFRPLSNLFAGLSSSAASKSRVAKNIGLGLLTGAGVFILSIGFLGGRASGVVDFLVSNFYSPWPLITAILLFLLVPASSEIFFHGVMFARLTEEISPLAALILSTLLFAFTWPVFSFPVGIALGCLSCMLFHRTRSLLACVVANSTATIMIETYLVFRALKLLP
jgi:membrane protease YdiL (CAAX protease family)